MTLNAFNGEIDEEINLLKEMIESINTELENLAAQVVRMDDRYSARDEEERDEEEEGEEEEDDDSENQILCVGVDLVLEGNELKLLKKKIVAKPFVTPEGQEEVEENLEDFEDCDPASVPVQECP